MNKLGTISLKVWEESWAGGRADRRMIGEYAFCLPGDYLFTGKMPTEKAFEPGRRGVLGGGFCVVVDHGVRRVRTGVEVEGAHLVAIERPSAAAAEDGELIAGFVDGAIAVDAFRNGECGAARARGGD